MQTQNPNVKTKNHNAKFKTDLKIRAYTFSLEIMNFVAHLPNQKIYWAISDQLFRSATSIGANIVEAKCSNSKKEFMRFYEIALKSSNESKYWLCLLRDGTLEVDKEKTRELIREAIEISNMLGSSLLTMKKRR